MNYYQRIKDLREDRNLKQKDIAQLLGIEQTNYSRYELGKYMLGIDTYIILAKFYNVSLDYLAGIVDTPRKLDGTPYTAKAYIIEQNGNNITNHFDWGRSPCKS